MAVTEDHTNLRWGSTLSGELADLVDNLVGGGLQPGWGSAGVGKGGGADALAIAVHATHLGGIRESKELSMSLSSAAETS